MKKNDFIKILERLSDKDICCWDDNEISIIDEIAECDDKIVFCGRYGTINQEYNVIKRIDIDVD